jgi:hypothetical protein
LAVLGGKADESVEKLAVDKKIKNATTGAEARADFGGFTRR